MASLLFIIGLVIITDVNGKIAHTITCQQNQDCTPTISNSSWNDVIIDGTNAASLTVSCQTCNNISIEIFCPSSQCGLNCGLSAGYNFGCKYSSFTFNGDSSDISINSYGGSYYVMNYTHISFINSINKLSFNCMDVGSCYQSIFDLSQITNSISNLLIDCQAGSSCQNSKFYGMGMDLDTIQTNKYITNLNVSCYSINSCPAMYVKNMIVKNSLTVSCHFYGACYQLQMDVIIDSEVETLTNIFCIATDAQNSAEGACTASIFNIGSYNTQRINDVTVVCNSFDCGWSAKFNFTNFNNVNVLCTGYSSCETAWFYADKTNAMDVYCGGNDACKDSSMFGPSSSINATHIRCAGVYSRSCTNMNILATDNYQYDYLDLECEWKNNSITCANITTKCKDIYGNDGGKTDANILYNRTSNITGYIYCDTGITSCCPYRNNISPYKECAKGSICTIDCSNSACAFAYINGSMANELIVNCYKPMDCNNTFIECPVNRTSTVNCYDQYASCSQISINYYGIDNIIDNGTINFNTKNHGTSTGVTIHASYINQIKYRCSTYNGCYYTTIYAEHSNKLIMTCTGNRFSCIYNAVYGYYTKEIDILCDSDRSCSFLTVYGIYSNLFTLSCALSKYSTFQDYPLPSCTGGLYYIPSNDKFNLECYGEQCGDVGSFYIWNNISSSMVEMNGCSDCGNTSECFMHSFNIYCNLYWDKGNGGYPDRIQSREQQTYFASNDSCLDIIPDSHCGCESFIQTAEDSFIDNTNVAQCWHPSDSSGLSTVAIVLIVIGSAICVLLTGFAIFCLIKKKPKKQQTLLVNQDGPDMNDNTNDTGYKAIANDTVQ